MTAATGFRAGEMTVIHWGFLLKRTVTAFAHKSLQELCGCPKAGEQLKEVGCRSSLCGCVLHSGSLNVEVLEGF